MADDDMDNKLDDDLTNLDNMDFMFDGEDPGEREPASMAKQLGSATLEGGKGFSVGVTRAITNTMPRTEGVVGDAVGFAQEIGSIKDEFMEELSPTVNAVKKAVNKSLPMMKKAMPDKLYAFLAKHSEFDAPEQVKSKDQLVAEEINDKVNSIFGQQEVLNKARFEVEQNDKLVDKVMTAANAKNNLAGLASIDNRLLFQNEFIAGTQTAWMKKMLELTYQQVYATKEHVNIAKQSTSILETRLEEIVHNTALPDMVKTRRSEIVADEFKHKQLAKLGDFAGSYLSRTKDNLRKAVKGGASGLLEQIRDAAEMKADMAEMQAEFGEGDAAKSAAEIASGHAGNLFGGVIGRKLARKLAPVINKLEGVSGNLQGNIAKKGVDLKNKMLASGNPLLDMLASILPDFANDTTISNEVLDSGDEAAVYDMQTRNTIVEIIPGYLSMMTKYLADMATGKENEAVRYDVINGKFTTESKLKSAIIDRALGDSETRSRSFMETAGIIRGAVKGHTGDTASFDEVSDDVMRFIANSAVNVAYLDPSAIRQYATSDNPENFLNSYIKVAFAGLKNPVATAKVLTSAMYVGDIRQGEAIREIENTIQRAMQAETYKEIFPQMMKTFGYQDLLRDFVTDDHKLNMDLVREYMLDVDSERADKTIASTSADYASDIQERLYQEEEFKDFMQDIIPLWAQEKISKVTNADLGVISEVASLFDNSVLQSPLLQEDIPEPVKKAADAVGVVNPTIDNAPAIPTNRPAPKKEDSTNKEALLEPIIDNIIEAPITPIITPNTHLPVRQVDVLPQLAAAPEPTPQETALALFDSSKELVDDHSLMVQSLVRADAITNESRFTDVTMPMDNARVLNPKTGNSFHDDFLAFVDYKYTQDALLLDAVLKIHTGGENGDDAILKFATTQLNSLKGVGKKAFKSVERSLRGSYDMIAGFGTGIKDMSIAALPYLQRAGRATLDASMRAGKYGMDKLAAGGSKVWNTLDEFINSEGDTTAKILEGLKGGGRGLKELLESGMGHGKDILMGISIPGPGKKKKEKFFDVYRKDTFELGKPLLSGHKQDPQYGNGVVFATGGPVKQTADITEPVLDPETGQTLISDDDIKAILVDVNGNPIANVGSSRTEGLLSMMGRGAKGITKLFGSGMDGYFDLAKQALGHGKALLTKGFEWLTNDSTNANNSDLTDVVSMLQKIHTLLDIRMPLKKSTTSDDQDGDGDIDGSYADQMANKSKEQRKKMGVSSAIATTTNSAGNNVRIPPEVHEEESGILSKGLEYAAESTVGAYMVNKYNKLKGAVKRIGSKAVKKTAKVPGKAAKRATKLLAKALKAARKLSGKEKLAAIALAYGTYYYMLGKEDPDPKRAAVANAIQVANPDVAMSNQVDIDNVAPIDKDIGEFDEIDVEEVVDSGVNTLPEIDSTISDQQKELLVDDEEMPAEELAKYIDPETGEPYGPDITDMGLGGIIAPIGVQAVGDYAIRKAATKATEKAAAKAIAKGVTGTSSKLLSGIPVLGGVINGTMGAVEADDMSGKSKTRGFIEGALTGGASRGSILSDFGLIEGGGIADKAIGGAAAVATGAMLGAGIGTMILPGIGTTAGAAIGGALGGAAEIAKYYSEGTGGAALRKLRMRAYGIPEKFDVDKFNAFEEQLLEVIASGEIVPESFRDDGWFGTNWMEVFGLDTSEPTQVAYFDKWLLKRAMVVGTQVGNVLKQQGLEQVDLDRFDNDDAKYDVVTTALETRISNFLDLPAPSGKEDNVGYKFIMSFDAYVKFRATLKSDPISSDTPKTGKRSNMLASALKHSDLGKSVGQAMGILDVEPTHETTSWSIQSPTATLIDWAFRNDSDVGIRVFKVRLEAYGLPSNLTPGELEEFEEDLNSIADSEPVDCEELREDHYISGHNWMEICGLDPDEKFQVKYFDRWVKRRALPVFKTVKAIATQFELDYNSLDSVDDIPALADALEKQLKPYLGISLDVTKPATFFMTGKGYADYANSINGRKVAPSVPAYTTSAKEPSDESKLAKKVAAGSGKARTQSVRNIDKPKPQKSIQGFTEKDIFDVVHATGEETEEEALRGTVKGTQFDEKGFLFNENWPLEDEEKYVAKAKYEKPTPLDSRLLRELRDKREKALYGKKITNARADNTSTFSLGVEDNETMPDYLVAQKTFTTKKVEETNTRPVDEAIKNILDGIPKSIAKPTDFSPEKKIVTATVTAPDGGADKSKDRASKLNEEQLALTKRNVVASERIAEAMEENNRLTGQLSEHTAAISNNTAKTANANPTEPIVVTVPVPGSGKPTDRRHHKVRPTINVKQG